MNNSTQSHYFIGSSKTMDIFLNEDHLQKIHSASLNILGNIGIIIDNPSAKEMLLDQGANEKNGRICITSDIIESAISKCPSTVILTGRKHEIQLGSGDLHIHNMGGARDVLELPEGELRPALSTDLDISTRLLDALENITSITPLYTPRDVPGSLMAITMFDRTLRNTVKPINGPGVTTAVEVKILFEMMQIVLGDCPKVSIGVSPVSPLNFSGDIPEVMLEVARHKLPFGPLPCPSVGATSPMSLAGSIALQNAENLASIALVQTYRPGLPVVYCGRLSVLNMHNLSPIWGNPEIGIMSAATVKLGHYYGLPVNVYGLSASGFACDIQSGYERAFNALVPALAGADELSGVGEMAGGIYSSNAQIVIDNDIMGMVQRIKRGFVVDDESLAVDVISKVMDTTRNFLKESHTRKFLRAGEIWQGKLATKEIGWESWNMAGSPDAVKRASDIAIDILSTHEVLPLPEDQTKELDRLIERLKS